MWVAYRNQMMLAALAACYSSFTAFEATNTEVTINLTALNDSLCPLEFRVAILASLECPAPQIIQFYKPIFTAYENISLRFTCRDTLASQQQLCENLLQDGKIDFHNSKVRLRYIDGREDLLDCGCTRDSEKTAIIVISIVCGVAIAGAATYVIYRYRYSRNKPEPAQYSSQIMNYGDFSDDSASSVSFLRKAEPVGNGSF